MTPFSNLSLRLKLVLVMSLASSVGLLVAVMAIIGNEVRAFSDRAEESVGAMAQVVGLSVSAALVFDDPMDATEALGALRLDPNIVAGALYEIDGRLFAQYTRAGERAARLAAAPGAEGAMFVGRHLAVVQPVIYADEKVGTLYVRSDLGHLYARLIHYISLTVILMGVGLIVAVLAATFLARRISAPIYELAGVARGVTKWKDYSMRAGKSTGGEIGLLIDSFNEMLQRIEANDAALKRTQSELELRVRERTAELESSNRSLSDEIAARKGIQFELMHARDLAEAANRAKSTFLANMSHDLRTPLTAVLGYSELLEEETTRNGHAQYARDLRQIQKAGAHLLSLLRDLLDLSKIEAGKMEVHPTRINLREFMHELADTAKPLCDANRNRLELVCPPDVDSLVTDRTRLRQVLLNLVSNAAKFTEDGTVKLAVERHVLNGHAQVAISVQDSGIGMSREQLQHIFEPFVQGNRFTAARYGGSGLGLAICKRCCDLMHAEIQVESRPGGGSTFRVSFNTAVKADNRAVVVGT